MPIGECLGDGDGMGIGKPSALNGAVKARIGPELSVSQRINTHQVKIFSGKIGQNDNAFDQRRSGRDALDCLQLRKEGIIDFTSRFQVRATRDQIYARGK